MSSGQKTPGSEVSRDTIRELVRAEMAEMNRVQAEVWETERRRISLEKENERRKEAAEKEQERKRVAAREAKQDEVLKSVEHKVENLNASVGGAVTTALCSPEFARMFAQMVAHASSQPPAAFQTGADQNQYHGGQGHTHNHTA